MLKIFVKPGNRPKGKMPAKLPVTDIMCPKCSATIRLVGFATLKGRYAMLCDACSELIPPVFELLESSTKRRAYHQFKLGASL